MAVGTNELRFTVGTLKTAFKIKKKKKLCGLPACVCLLQVSPFLFDLLPRAFVEPSCVDSEMCVGLGLTHSLGLASLVDCLGDLRPLDRGANSIFLFSSTLWTSISISLSLRRTISRLLCGRHFCAENAGKEELQNRR